MAGTMIGALCERGFDSEGRPKVMPESRMRLKLRTSGILCVASFGRMLEREWQGGEGTVVVKAWW